MFRPALPSPANPGMPVPSFGVFIIVVVLVTTLAAAGVPVPNATGIVAAAVTAAAAVLHRLAATQASPASDR